MTSSSAVAVLSGATILPRLQQIKAENKHEGIYMASINHILCYTLLLCRWLACVPSLPSPVRLRANVNVISSCGECCCVPVETFQHSFMKLLLLLLVMCVASIGEYDFGRLGVRVGGRSAGRLVGFSEFRVFL